MRVLILSDREGSGGAEKVASVQARELARAGLEVRLLTAEGLPNYGPRFRNWRMLWNRAGVNLFRKTLIDFKPDIVHCHNIHDKFSFAVLKIAQKSGAKVFLTAHDTYLFYPGKYFPPPATQPSLGLRYNPFRNLVIKYYLKYIHQIFAVSDALGESLRAHGIASVTLHNGVDVLAWQAEYSKLEEFKIRYNLAGRKVILWVGRLSDLKGGVVVPAMIDRVRSEVSEAVILGIGKEVKLTNEEMPLAYAVADVVIVPSVYLDPFPTIVLEAGASGRPVVVTNMGGAKEAVVEGETGFVADPYSPVFADKIIELLRNHEKARKMGEKAREHISSNFSLKKQVEKLGSCYTAAYKK